MKRIFIFILAGLMGLNTFAESSPKLKPVFAPQPEGLVWVEAEDAVTTNMTDQATLDYASSGYRMLQLNREGTAKGAPFYAEYTFVVPATGTWNLWIGGTPPGPESDLLASFVSPLSIIIDNQDPLPAHREQVEVVEKYSNTNHWYVLKQGLTLSAGIHTIRFEISEQRRYDSRYYFFLDAFFLLHKDSPLAKGSVDRTLVPQRFPLDLANRKIDNPYLTIPQYEYAIQQNPKNKEGYLLLAQVYSLIGDHGSAIKTLSRGKVMAGEDSRFTLLAAKSRIWSGEIDEGIRLYKEYLKTPDADREVWAEAAKICAWLMKYQDAEDLYRQAIAKYPDDLNLKVNYALTLLWESKVREGERKLTELWQNVKTDPQQIFSLGSIYDTSGYPDKAINVYLEGAQEHPEQIEMYLRLVRTYNKTNQSDKAAEIRNRISDLYEPSDTLSSVLTLLDQEAALKEQVLENYRQRLLKDPDNLDLRMELVRAYSWNGKLSEALTENQNILINKLYSILVSMDTDLHDTYRLMDLLQLLKEPATGLPIMIDERIGAIKKAQENLKQAMVQDSQAQKSTDSVKREKAQAALQNAQTQLAREVARSTAIAQWAETFLLPRVQGYIEQVNGSAAQISQDAEVLNAVKPWTWPIADDITFLASLAKTNPLAQHGLLRIQLLEGLAPVIPSLEEVQLENTKKVVRQALLWKQQQIDNGLFSPDTYFTYSTELQSVYQDVLPKDPAESIFTEFTNQDADNVIRKLQDLKIQGGQLGNQIQTAQNVLLRQAALRLRVRMYQYDTETLWDRQALADLFLRLGQPASAVKTLERVLILNPSDIASLFTLARAKEQSGDWMGALSMYRRVYDLNPRYENAAGSYNTLSALHGQLFQTGITSTVDSNRSANTFRIAYSIPLSSFAELSSQYSLDHIKIHTPTASTQSLTLHNLTLQLPISITSLGLTLYGELGGSLQNKLENIIPPSVADFNLDLVADYAAVAPQYGGGFSWETGPFRVGSTYGFHQIKDSFFADRFAQYEHQAGASVQLFFDFPNRQLVRSFSFQTNGNYRYIFSPYFSDQTNIIYSGRGELHLQNVLAQKPQILLDIGALGSWEDSEKSSTDYFTPAQALTIKGGAELSFQLINGTNWNVTGSSRLWSGWFASEGNAGSLLLDGSLRLEGVRRNVSLYLALGGNKTGETYWAFSLEIGGSIRLVDYIIP